MADLGLDPQDWAASEGSVAGLDREHPPLPALASSVQAFKATYWDFGGVGVGTDGAPGTTFGSSGRWLIVGR